MADDITPGATLRVCAHYRCGKGQVFVDVDDYVYGPLWEVRPASEVGDDATIITCARCDQPAVQLDHLYPYEESRNLCAEHLEVWNEEEKQAKADLRRKIDRLHALDAELGKAQKRITELEAEVAALKAKRCETCKAYLCGYWCMTHRYSPSANASCSEWQPKPATQETADA